MAAQYVFHTTWLIPAPRKRVHDVLVDYERYPLWWPEVRSVESVSDGMATVARSSLPYDLRFTVLQYSLDDGSLVGQLTGDLEGVAHWELYDTGGGTRAEYHQEVSLEKRGLRHLSPVLRPAFRFNHWLMMRDGYRGLRAYIAGYGAGAGSASTR